MFLFIFLFGLALGAEIPSGDPEVKLQRGNCPMFWFSFNDRCYKYVAARKSWADAEIHCMSENANLVSIHSQEEEKFVQYLVTNSDPSQGSTWLGLSDKHKEGFWMWSDASKVDFVYWASGQPNNGAGGTEHCVHSNYNSHKWNDVACSDTYPFVCKSRVCP